MVLPDIQIAHRGIFGMGKQNLLPSRKEKALSVNVNKENTKSLGLIIAFIVLSLAIISCSALYYHHYELNFRALAEGQLSAIAKLKVDDLMEWRKERLADGAIFYRNSDFAALVKRYFKNPEDIEARDRLQTWLDKFATNKQYDRVFLLDIFGLERISKPDKSEPVAAYFAKEIADVFHSRNITFLDFHRDTPNGPIHLALLVPIFDDKNNRPLSVLVLRIDPNVYLYPYIQTWPIPSKTSETLIARREGNTILFLNELKFQKNTALKLQIPLKKTALPVVEAVLGHEGTMEGIDYRGMPVLAAIRSVPDSPWFLVARVDIGEVFAPLRARLSLMVLFIFIILAGMGGCLFLFLRQQRMRFYQEKLKDAEALRESEEKFRNEFDNSAIGKSFTSLDGSMEVNPAFCDMLGYTKEELAHQNWQDFTHPDDNELTQKLLKELLSGEKSTIRFRKRYIKKDGSIVWADVSTVLQKDKEGKPLYYITAVVDITERKRAEEALTESEAKFRNLFDNAQVGMFRTKMDGSAILEVNRNLLDTFGFTREEMLASPSTMRWAHPEEREKMVQRLRAEGIVTNLEVAFITKAGMIRDFQMSLKPYIEQGILEGSALDITERKSMEEKVHQYNVQLEQKSRDLEQIIYVTSHDLRSPLVNVQGFAKELSRSIMALMEAINTGDISAEAMQRMAPILKKDIPESLEYIKSGIARMDLQLSALLKLSRLGRAAITIENLDMNRLVYEVVDSLEYVTKEKGAQFHLAKLPPCRADSAQTNQIFLNLIENALKYLDAKRLGSIRISGNKLENDVVYCVEDNGVGIQLECQDKIFEIFYRVEQSTCAGEGLGLTIVRQSAERQNGTVWVESEPGTGSRFFVKLPGI